ncbi:MAG: hypothetical protein Ct9H300mP14_01350 [Gammaproteobacteria bacterium]|nr:MAG: hypothetical protein Ct9H300mP14_01350 [Gammaproteobacteria bacterium]
MQLIKGFNSAWAARARAPLPTLISNTHNLSFSTLLLYDVSTWAVHTPRGESHSNANRPDKDSVLVVIAVSPRVWQGLGSLAIVPLRTHHMRPLMSPHNSPWNWRKDANRIYWPRQLGGKLASSLQRNGFDLMVRDLDRQVATPFIDPGGRWAESPAGMTRQTDMVITVPNPRQALRAWKQNGFVRNDGGKIWAK